MKAADARQLTVGDWVTANFGCNTKKCEIIAIDWPTFRLRTKDYRGDEMIRTRRYTSLWSKTEPAGPTSTRSAPSWLTWPTKGE